MCSQEQVKADVEFGRSLAAGPQTPLIDINSVSVSNKDRYEWFVKTLMGIGVSPLDHALKIHHGLIARNEIRLRCGAIE